jgi:A118 family predicted phage portal protein
MTYQTRSSYLTQVQKQITAMIRAVFELAKCGNLFSDGQPRWNGNVDDLQINIDFADGVFVDKDAQLKNDLSMVAVNTLSKQTFLVRNLGMSKEQAQQELSLIKSETPEQPINENQQESDFLNGGDE